MRRIHFPFGPLRPNAAQAELSSSYIVYSLSNQLPLYQIIYIIHLFVLKRTHIQHLPQHHSSRVSCAVVMSHTHTPHLRNIYAYRAHSEIY